MTEDEKREFEEFLKWKEEKTRAIDEKKSIVVDDDNKANERIKPPIGIWYLKLTNGQKNWLMVYLIWFIIHVVLLVSGKEYHDDYGYVPSGFYPFGDCDSFSEFFDSCDFFALYYYSTTEFIVYVVLIPVVFYFIYTLYKRYLK